MRASGLPVSEWSDGPGYTYALHSHTYKKMLCCLEGSIVFHLAEKKATPSRTRLGEKQKHASPTTSVIIPSNGADFGGSQILDAAASDNVGVDKVEFHVTGGSLNDALIATATPTQYGWLAGWDTTTVPDGTYTLQSVAYDTAGNSTHSAGISITVDNTPPTTSVLIPSNGASLTGTQTLDASASDNVGVTKVEFHLTGGSYNDNLIATASLTYYGWLASWATTTVPDGNYTLQGVAYDAAGNSAHSAGISITVAN